LYKKDYTEIKFSCQHLNRKKEEKKERGPLPAQDIWKVSAQSTDTVWACPFWLDLSTRKKEIFCNFFVDW